ncbi:MAG: MspA family porin [Segniliparus sp.]|uniref:MspA family porin n=1 Tax=Segniliparus sp. TaxID=2804064 RepID=UPI003F3D19CB
MLWSKKRSAANALAACLGAWGALVSSTGTAYADTTVDLPDDSITQTLPDGTVVTLSVRDQYAIISPAMVAVQTSRNMWANGTVRVDVEGDIVEGRITPGYIVGCQFTFGAQAGGQFNGGASSPGTDLNAGVGISALSAIGSAAGSITSPQSIPAAILNGAQGVGNAVVPALQPYLPEGAIGFSIGPGQSASVNMLSIEEPDDYGNQSFDNYFVFGGNHGGITYTDVTFQVDGCAGYAQARAFTKVRVKNSTTMAWVTIWGPPFSIG